MRAPKKIRDLVKQFEKDIEGKKKGSIGETDIRVRYINPMFEELGWQTRDRKIGKSSSLEVIHEYSQSIGGRCKKPDYAFKIGHRLKFFVEAKKPSVNIKESRESAYQARRYGHSAGIPVILTDFEEFAVYDIHHDPKLKDDASVARRYYFTFKDYLEKWNKISELFSRDGVESGSLEQFTYKGNGKGSEGIDVKFLNDIESWRSSLAKNIALRNKEISQRSLNTVVQKTIDRILFLRICEDRGIEDEGNLNNLLKSKNIYKHLCKVFLSAEIKYNSSLFYFTKEKDKPPESHPENEHLQLQIDDQQLNDIISRLYFPESPYEFSVMPVEVLGQVYEQFLGKAIVLDKNHEVIVEEKPEVKKAGGVYYTPTYIVDYIVENSVGKILDKAKTTKKADKIKVVDPACGSGSFLLGAYQYFLDWYLKKYAAKKVKDEEILYQGMYGEWHLTVAEKKRILLNNIYGVDIDAQAVEVCKLSLLLKALEGETKETINHQRMLFQERALPDLSNNIKWGNSLIGSDFYDDQQTSFIEEDEQYRINAFDWDSGFKKIMRNGGFDAVIGNPPYGFLNNPVEKIYYENNYQTTEGRFDNYELFIEKGSLLLNKKGLLGFIVPSPFLSNLYSKKLRNYLIVNYRIQEITNFGMDVFAQPTVHTCIIIFSHNKDSCGVVKIRKQVNQIKELKNSYDYQFHQKNLGDNENGTFDIFIDLKKRKVLHKIDNASKKLGEICFIRQCIKTGNDSLYVKELDGPPPEPWKPTLRGKQVLRYQTLKTKLHLKYGSWLARNWQNKTFYETQKIIIRETGKQITATIDLEKRYLLSSLYSVYPKKSEDLMSLKYILGILNSEFANYFMKIIAFDLTKGAFTKIRTNQLSRLPIRTIDFSISKEKASHGKMVQLVESMLSLNKGLLKIKTSEEKTLVQRQISSIDGQINKLVYELYGLKANEVSIFIGN